MTLWWRGSPKEPRVPAGQGLADAAEARTGGAVGRNTCSPYSPQYQTIVAQGHERPTPSFGAPALVWHVGIWPRRKTDDGEPCDPHDTAHSRHGQAKLDFESRRAAWVDQIREFVGALRRRGCHPMGDQPLGSAKDIGLVAPHDLDWAPSAGEDDFFRPVDILDPGIAPFTLWWRDRSETGDAAARRHAIRICVHPEINADYACLSFYMDIGQVWNDGQSGGAGASQGQRRATSAPSASTN